MGNLEDIIHDSDLHVRNQFDRMTRTYLLSVLNDDLIAEHRRKPEGHHSEPLTRLLAWCHRRPPSEQYVVRAEGTGDYRIAQLSGQRRKLPLYIGEERFGTIQEARHGVFLQHIKDLTGK